MPNSNTKINGRRNSFKGTTDFAPIALGNEEDVNGDKPKKCGSKPKSIADPNLSKSNSIEKTHNESIMPAVDEQ